MNAFKKLGLSDEIVQAVTNKGYAEPTEIQEKSIPLILEGKDIIGGSATGSGKTFAFGAGIIDHIDKSKHVSAIILTPTRELAEQVHDQLKQYSQHKKLYSTPVYGGVNIERQFKEIEKADIVVGTPGRVLDHLQRRTLDLSHVSHVVLDEADRMLDMGFIDDVRKILGECNPHRQTLLFSATISSDIKRLANDFMKSPQRVDLEKYVDPRKLKQVYYIVDRGVKFSLLVHLLKEEKSELVMVFCNSRRVTDRVERGLQKNGIQATAIHGGLAQNKRSRVLQKFSEGGTHVLVATDVAARGLDIPDVSHVYNYDIPDDTKQYVHRVGRTARAGESGQVINLITEHDRDNFQRIYDEHDMTFTREETPQVERIRLAPAQGGRGGFKRGRSPQRRGYGGRGGNRGRSGGRKSSGNRGRSRQGGRKSGGRRGGRKSSGNRSGPRKSGGRRPPKRS